MLFLSLLLTGQEPKRTKVYKGRVDTTVTVTRWPRDTIAVMDTIQIQQMEQMRELDELVKKAKKR